VRVHHRLGVLAIEVQSLLAGELVSKLPIRGVDLSRDVDGPLRRELLEPGACFGVVADIIWANRLTSAPPRSEASRPSSRSAVLSFATSRTRSRSLELIPFADRPAVPTVASFVDVVWLRLHPAASATASAAAQTAVFRIVDYLQTRDVAKAMTSAAV
jgi:hypothetical protein